MTGHIASIVKQKEMEAAGYSYFRLGSSLRVRKGILPECMSVHCLHAVSSAARRGQQSSGTEAIRSSSRAVSAEQALESRDVYFRHLDSLDQGGLWVCWGCLDHINLMREDSSTVGGTIPCV